jgi:glutathione S-transferase
MIFYFAKKSVAIAAHLALEESGASYEAREIDFAATEQRSDNYLQINPKGRVPALATDEGIITETPAILAYIAQTNPAANLAPINNPYLFAKCQEFNLYLCATVHVAHAHRVRGNRWADDNPSILAMQNKVAENMSDYFELIESEMFLGPWVLGDDYSICDAYLFTVTQWLKGDGVELSKYPIISDFEKRMRSREAVKRVTNIYGI